MSGTRCGDKRGALRGMAILDYTADVWRKSLGIKLGEEPVALILEGTWWRETATKTRLSYLDSVRELSFPEIYVGHWQGCKIAYCCAYGAARAVEPAHIFAQLGTPLIIQIGTCGSLDPDATTGMVMLPESCVAHDGVSPAYGAGEVIATDQRWVDSAAAALESAGLRSKRVHHLTWPSLFAQSEAMCDAWRQEGIISIDMETSAVVAAAHHFGASAVSMLSVWDVLTKGRTFLDPLTSDEEAMLKRSNQHIFDVALGLALEASENMAA